MNNRSERKTVTILEENIGVKIFYHLRFYKTEFLDIKKYDP